MSWPFCLLVFLIKVTIWWFSANSVVVLSILSCPPVLSCPSVHPVHGWSCGSTQEQEPQLCKPRVLPLAPGQTG